MAETRGDVCVGLMSGTSLDGISAAVVRFNTSDSGAIEPQLLAFIGTTYSAAQRDALMPKLADLVELYPPR